MSGGGCCKELGPGYANPMDAFKNSKKEKLLYLPCIVPTKDRPDYLVTIDVDENSRDYGKVCWLNWMSKTNLIKYSEYNKNLAIIHILMF